MDYKKAPLFVLAWLAAILIGAMIGTTVREHNCRLQEKETEARCDTVERHDTVYIPAPAAVRDTVLMEVPVTLPVDTPVIPEMPDSVTVRLPVIPKEYSDSSYHAWVSGGGFVSLDSIRVFQRQRYVTHTVYQTSVHKKNRRWGVGVQAGYGWDGKGFSPYVGVGVTYVLWGW